MLIHSTTFCLKCSTKTECFVNVNVPVILEQRPADETEGGRAYSISKPGRAGIHAANSASESSPVCPVASLLAVSFAFQQTVLISNGCQKACEYLS